MADVISVNKAFATREFVLGGGRMKRGVREGRQVV